MPSKRILTGLALAFLTLCTTACSPMKVKPPADLLADCPHADAPADRTNGGLADFALRERQALDTCNADKAALRAWAKEL